MTLEKLYPRARYAVVRVEANGKRQAVSLMVNELTAREAAKRSNAFLGSKSCVRYEAVRIKRTDKKGEGK